MSELPKEFDAELYVRDYSDLNGYSPEQAINHYQLHGRAEGRRAALLSRAEDFVSFIKRSEDGPILEIGPFCNPQFRGEGVYYLDYLDAESLRNVAIAHGLPPENVPEVIHFTQGLRGINQIFSAVFSSHSLEHQPDLVEHFAGVASVLHAGGRYYAVIPDKRYCFDAFLPESTIAGVLQAHHEHRTLHTLENFLLMSVLQSHNEAHRHWRNDHGVFDSASAPLRIKGAFDLYQSMPGQYLDAHAWRFTPDSFRLVMSILHAIDLCGLRLVRLYETVQDRFEFCAVLEKV